MTLSLYNHVQNDCQIYRPGGVFCFVVFLIQKCIFFLLWKMLPIWSFFCGGSLCVSLLWFGWFFFLLIALVTALPQKNLYPPYWFCPQEHTDTHSRAFPFSCLFTFINPLMQNKMCTCGNLRVFSSVCPSDVLHLQPQLGPCMFSKQLGEKKSLYM